MGAFENTIEYHELILTLDNLDTNKTRKLPHGYKFLDNGKTLIKTK